MTRVRMSLADGDEVLLASSDLADVGIEPVGRGPSATRSADTVRDAMRQVTPATREVLDRGRALRGDETSLDVEIKVTGEASLAIAKAAGEANFTVHMEWNRVADDKPEVGRAER